MFPPSFYYTHMEKVKRITAETLIELYAILEKFEAQNSLQVTELKEKHECALRIVKAAFIVVAE